MSMKKVFVNIIFLIIGNGIKSEINDIKSEISISNVLQDDVTNDEISNDDNIKRDLSQKKIDNDILVGALKISNLSENGIEANNNLKSQNIKENGIINSNALTNNAQKEEIGFFKRGISFLKNLFKHNLKPKISSDLVKKHKKNMNRLIKKHNNVGYMAQKLPVAMQCYPTYTTQRITRSPSRLAGITAQPNQIPDILNSLNGEGRTTKLRLVHDDKRSSFPQGNVELGQPGLQVVECSEKQYVKSSNPTQGMIINGRSNGNTQGIIVGNVVGADGNPGGVLVQGNTSDGVILQGNSNSGVVIQGSQLKQPQNIIVRTAKKPTRSVAQYATVVCPADKAGTVTMIKKPSNDNYTNEMYGIPSDNQLSNAIITSPLSSSQKDFSGEKAQICISPKSPFFSVRDTLPNLLGLSANSNMPSNSINSLINSLTSPSFTPQTAQGGYNTCTCAPLKSDLLSLVGEYPEFAKNLSSIIQNSKVNSMNKLFDASATAIICFLPSDAIVLYVANILRLYETLRLLLSTTFMNINTLVCRMKSYARESAERVKQLMVQLQNTCRKVKNSAKADIQADFMSKMSKIENDIGTNVSNMKMYAEYVCKLECGLAQYLYTACLDKDNDEDD